MRRAAVLLVALVVGACGAPAPPGESAHGTVLTEGRGGWRPDPRARYPDGAQLVRIGPDGARSVLSEGLAAAGAPCVHHEGGKLLFVGREAAGGPFRVYECAADGTGRRVAVDHGADCVRAAYLPDGRIVYAAARSGIAPLDGNVRPTALFVANGDGSPGAPITFGTDLDTDPTVLTDGRVLFASWRPSREGGGRLGLFTVHPDGTGYAPFHLAEVHTVYPVQQRDGDVRFLCGGDDGGAGAGRERVVAWDAPLTVSGDADAGGEAVSLAPRPRPQGHLSALKPDVAHGTIVCVDARATGAAAATQFQVTTGGGERVVLGRAPLADDGSFIARVPSDVPLLLQLLDASGTPVRAEQGPFWVRSNEVRVCVSCHDDVETSPPNHRPAAVLGEAVDMTGGGR